MTQEKRMEELERERDKYRDEAHLLNEERDKAESLLATRERQLEAVREWAVNHTKYDDVGPDNSTTGIRACGREVLSLLNTPPSEDESMGDASPKSLASVEERIERRIESYLDAGYVVSMCRVGPALIEVTLVNEANLNRTSGARRPTLPAALDAAEKALGDGER